MELALALRLYTRSPRESSPDDVDSVQARKINGMSNSASVPSFM
jgi:hypothetical protein